MRRQGARVFLPLREGRWFWSKFLLKLGLIAWILVAGWCAYALVWH